MPPELQLGTSSKTNRMISVTDSNDEELFQDLHSQLSHFGQEHLLRFWNELTTAQRHELINELSQIDFEQIQRLYNAYGASDSSLPPIDSLSQPPGFALDDGNPRFSRSEAEEVGEAVLRAGTVGVAIVAGGQGTRLGFPHPKGMYPIGPLSGASLFEIHLKKIRAASVRYGSPVPVYVMTSPATHKETVVFFEQKKGFGNPQEDIVLFCQGSMPAVDQTTGKILLAEKHQLAQSPDGHGGLLAALARSQAFDHMRRRGIEHLFYMQVDDPLVDVVAPHVIGYHVLANADATTLVVRKDDPLQKVGNVVLMDGKTLVIEYSDLSEEVAKLRRPDGGLLLWAGNTGVHVWDVSLLEGVAASKSGLPFHYALKQVTHVDEHGKRIEPQEPIAIKFERFIFDLLPAARRAILFEVDKKRTFAPLKNPSGSPSNSPEFVQQRMAELYRQWIIEAGAEVNENLTIEIDPLYADNAAEVASRIKPGTQFREDQVLM